MSDLPDLSKILPKRETTLRVSQVPANNRNNHTYHTLRYGFKPASVDSDEPAALELTKSGQVTILAPNVGGSISSQTVFRGHRRPHVKECLLVIDHNTGEIVLQKLTDNITVKATRGVGASGNNGNNIGGASSGGANNINVASNSNSILNPNSNSSSSSIVMSNNDQPPEKPAPSQPDRPPDGPQLSEDSSSSMDSDDSSRSRTSSTSSSSSSSSSSSGNSSPNNEGFTF